MSVQRVVVVRSGGFAGLIRTAEVDDPEHAERLSEAVLASADAAPDRAVRDGFVYAFTLVRVTSTRTVDLPDGALSPQLRDAVRTLFSS